MSIPRRQFPALWATLSTAWVVSWVMALAGPVHAHASEQGFVLLLPTGVYILAGTTSVALTIFLVSVLPDRTLQAAFRPHALMHLRASPRGRHVTSCLSFLLLVWLVWIGMEGPRDPLSNPLPLFIWTLWWGGFVTIQGLLGNLWGWLNPWTGPVAVARVVLRLRPFLRYPTRFGHSLAIASFLGFVAILLADPAPSDPMRLAVYVGGYWLVSFLALLMFGPRWMHRAEGFSVLMRSYSRMGLFGRSGRRAALGLSGWRVLTLATPAPGLAVFVLLMLGSGSFDGLNETFWWLDLLGINPLEFPGRSAVMVQNLVGLAIANLALLAMFLLTLCLGLALARVKMGLARAFCVFAPSILPIALGYHIAHYLPSFLVDVQYALAAASDPMKSGADYLGLGQFYVTTGFFNSQASVRVIWLSQAAAVVGGHIIAVMLAHAIAVRHFGPGRRAVLSQVPLALFMILYTLFGLWLLASPRGA